MVKLKVSDVAPGSVLRERATVIQQKTGRPEPFQITAHVHVTGAGQAKINLLDPGGGPELVYSVDISRADMRRLMEEAAEHRAHILAEWERSHSAD